jgi:hypothetical protein
VAATNKCTSIASNFDGHAEASTRFMWHHPMNDVQGHIGSHWMPPLGNYLLHIAPANARGTTNHTAMNKYTYFVGRFDGHCDVAVQYRAHRPMEEVRASLEATGCHHRASTCSDSHQLDIPTPVFLMFFIVKSLKRSQNHIDSP